MSITFADIGEVYAMSDIDRYTLAEPVIGTLKELIPISADHYDNAGIPIRGGSVYDDILDYRFTRQQLAAARQYLLYACASGQVITALERARPNE